MGTSKPPIIKLEEYLTKKPPQRKTEALVGRRGEGGEKKWQYKGKAASVCLHNIVREILWDCRKCSSPWAHVDLEGKDAFGESHTTTSDHAHVRSFLSSPSFLNASEGKMGRLLAAFRPRWTRKGQTGLLRNRLPNLGVFHRDHTLLDFHFTPSNYSLSIIHLSYDGTRELIDRWAPTAANVRDFFLRQKFWIKVLSRLSHTDFIHLIKLQPPHITISWDLTAQDRISQYFQTVPDFIFYLMNGLCGMHECYQLLLSLSTKRLLQYCKTTLRSWPKQQQQQ